jgi:hypothetical protein
MVLHFELRTLGSDGQILGMDAETKEGVVPVASEDVPAQRAAMFAEHCEQALMCCVLDASAFVRELRQFDDHATARDRLGERWVGNTSIVRSHVRSRTLEGGCQCLMRISEDAIEIPLFAVGQVEKSNCVLADYSAARFWPGSQIGVLSAPDRGRFASLDS